MILTVDLGTTVTKAVMWGEHGPVGIGRATIATTYPQPGWVEQEPGDWWDAFVEAVGLAVGSSPRGADLGGIAFSAARETFVPVDDDGSPRGAGLVWSDRRAELEAGELEVHAGASAAKALWLQRHDPARLFVARWLLSPRDWIVWRLTGRVVTDRTLASRTGWYAGDGVLKSNPFEHLLPPVVASADVVGEVGGGVASGAHLPIPAGTPVVIGAGDRACEVLGAGAGADRPMVSWGTTANLSVPMPTAPSEPGAVAVSAGALGGVLLECGLSAAGAAVDWLARLTGLGPAQLRTLAEAAAPGAGGVLALPWFNGARAPWWQSGARAAFVGLTPSAEPADLARAIFEGVAFDVARSAELVAQVTGTAATSFCGAGGGAASDLWPSILAAVSQRPVERRAHVDLAASAGARVIAAAALGDDVGLDAINPVVTTLRPDATLSAAYQALRPSADRAARAALEL